MCSKIGGEIQIKEILLRRYTDIDYILKFDLNTFIQFIEIASEKEKQDKIHAQWCTMLPFMSMKLLEYVPFNEYMDRLTGNNVDMRPSQVIINEIMELHRKEGENYKHI